MLDELAKFTVDSIRDVSDPFEAEHWASTLLGSWRQDAPPGEMVDAPLFQAFVHALRRRGTDDALAALRALDAIGAPFVGDAAEALAASGTVDPSWLSELGSRPTAAVLLHEPAFDDGVSVLLEFAEPSGPLHTFSVYIDHNLGGVVKDVFLGDGLAEVRATMDRSPDRARVEYRDLDFGEARARVEAALDALDHTFDPPVDEEVYALRTLIEARLRLLPEGTRLPETWHELPQQDRDALREEFLSANEGRRWRGDDEAEYIAQLAIDFGADYNHGGPLRWSAVVVEIFMLDWLGRKITEEAAFFERVPEVLATWVSFAGRRRGVPDDYVGEAVSAVADYREEMLATVGDPETWGPAKIFATAAKEAGVDLSDSAALDRFIEQHNAGGRPGPERPPERD